MNDTITLKTLASDNNAGVHPAVLEAIAQVNRGDVLSYGDDAYTRSVEQKFKQVFEKECSVFFVFNGTAANVLALSALLPSWGAVVCSDVAHIHTDECAAPERFLGSKLISLPSVAGKIQANDLIKVLHLQGNEHHAQPSVLSITQVTELGTLYTTDEIAELSSIAHRHNLSVHIDGSRFANALAASGKSAAEMSWKAGVDILSMGGTKNGLMCAEAIVVFDNEKAQVIKYLRKQGMQLASKMRFLAAQFDAYLSNDLWLRNASHANAMTQLLYAGLQTKQQITIEYPVQANAIFAGIPRSLIEQLQKEYMFYVWDEERNIVRWMTSYSTQEADIKAFCALIP
jgi:threonine aldolase